MNEMYLVALVGEDVYKDFLEVGLISSFRDLEKVRKILYKRYQIEFEERSSDFTGNSWKFANITDPRNIWLYVKRLPIFE